MSIKVPTIKNFLIILCLLAFVAFLGGCSGDDGAVGVDGQSAFDIAVDNGFTGTEEEWLLAQAGVDPESCVICHDGNVVRSGDSHQAVYDELFQQDIVVASAVLYSYDAVGGNDVVTFEMTKNGADFDCTMADAVNIRFSIYTGVDNAEFIFSPAVGFPVAINGTLSYDALTNVCTSTKPESVYGDLTLLDGVIAVYGYDELVSSDPVAHLSLARYPYAAVIETGPLGVDYVSAANVTGCENCHTTPYYKHGYITGDVGAGVGDLDFYTCKVCHVDDRAGGHEDWQRIVDDPQGWAAGTPLTPLQETRYAYTTRLMNDVHMSHAMEFPYPQSMANCATCHAGKLTQTLSDANFTLETCKSCHPIDGGTDTADADGNFAYDTTGLALSNLITASGFGHGSVDLDNPAQNCNNCHKDPATGGIGPVFSAIHTGYNAEIYADTAGAKYSDTIIATVDAADFDAVTGMLTISASATGTAGTLDSATINPTLLVGLYGWNTKDFLIGPHARDIDSTRNLEAGLGNTHARVTGVEVAPVAPQAVAWQFTANLSDWADLIADGTVTRAEIAIMPDLDDANGDTVALNAPSRTFDLDANAFDDAYFDAIVDVANCNTCHDALATTFHSGNRGGNIVVCRLCHITLSGGSHLQGQSRSIDSYVHAVHSFQPFDVDEIDFTDEVEAAHYEEHVSFLFPDFATINCMACHNAGKFNVPDQSKSMPGLLSSTDEFSGISAGAPEVVVGPAARACGGCHRAQALNAGDIGGAAAFNQHTKDFGYRVENDADDTILQAIVFYIMEMF